MENIIKYNFKYIHKLKYVYGVESMDKYIKRKVDLPEIQVIRSWRDDKVEI